jgi:hypothetical protein
MLPDTQVHALDACRVDVPAMRREHLLDCFEGAEDYVVVHSYQTLAPHRLHHLGIEQGGQRHPARLGSWPGGLPTGELHPLAIVREQGCHVRLEALGQQQGGAVRGQHLGHLMDHALGHRQGALASLHAQEQLALGIGRRPGSAGGPRELLDRLGCTDVAGSHGTEHRLERIKLDLMQV